MADTPNADFERRQQHHLLTYAVQTAWDLVVAMEQAGMGNVTTARRLASLVELEARLAGVAVETNASRIIKRGQAGGRDVKPGSCP